MRQRFFEFLGTASGYVAATRCIGYGLQTRPVFIGGIAKTETDQMNNDALLAKLARRLDRIPTAAFDSIGDKYQCSIIL